jgi:hypothetical protein
MVRLLTAVVRDARRRGDHDALAIAREERSRFMVGARRMGAAVRDLTAAAGRYSDRVDKLRVLHRLAELMTVRGDLLAAREALLAAMDHADERQRAHSVQRLRTVARALGDELALRRTRGQGAGDVVMLAPLRSSRVGSHASAASRLRRWRSVAATPRAAPVLSRGHAG